MDNDEQLRSLFKLLSARLIEANTFLLHPDIYGSDMVECSKKLAQ